MSYNKVAFVTSKDSDQTAHLSAVLPETPPVTIAIQLWKWPQSQSLKVTDYPI